ncbi:unnamed protein product [Haemonchus placei]|uniref:SERTA domain-containing protein n=1 Tax=Haemonchus placei TaxID=6290 RepID=A0A0N4X656_HAEPC|nr:unnamed protein product [Haemonchus placei]
MLFASGLRKAVDQADPSAAAILITAEETNRLLLEKRRRQMIRRHTCSSLKPEVDRTVSFLTPQLAIAEDDSETSQPLPPSITAPSITTRPAALDDWGTSAFALPAATAGSAAVPPYTPANSAPAAASSVDDFDDEWTDDDDDMVVSSVDTSLSVVFVHCSSP